MTLHIRPESPASALEQNARIVLGMPHLCPNGLSENWLWKELGHRHWDLIGRVFGRAGAGFDPSGPQPTYAAFRRIALRDGDLGAVGENDTLHLRSTLTQVSATRVESRHIVEHRDALVADVGMTSVFVRRQTGGVNRSVVRVRLAGMPDVVPLLTDPATPGPPREAAPPAGPEGEEIELGTVVVEPCPSLDFNGAGLLYFSSFVAAVDRAEWRLFGKGKTLNGMTRRDAAFHANIEIGDDLAVQVLAAPTSSGCRHRALVRSRADGKLLAEIITARAP